MTSIATIAPAIGRWLASVIVPAIEALPLDTCGASAAASAATLPGVGTWFADPVRPSGPGARATTQSRMGATSSAARGRWPNGIRPPTTGFGPLPGQPAILRYRYDRSGSPASTYGSEGS